MNLAEIGLAWLAYFALHSLLASSGVKIWIGGRWSRFMRGYRIAYNLIASVALLPVLWLIHATESGWLWQWRGAWGWLSDAIALAAIACFFASARAYDMGEFLGLRQLSGHPVDELRTFTLSSFHRFVRHPWYCIALVLIWTRDMNGPLLVSALSITIYFIVGSRLEERKLIASYGETYRQYMAKVPGLIPLPWKYLSATEARNFGVSRICR